MSFDLGKLFIEWRRIVPNGVPNPKNDYHLVLLKEICFAKGIDKDIIDSVILALEQEETFTAKKKDTGKVVAFKSKESRDDAIEGGDYEEVDKKDDEKKKEKPSADHISKDYEYTRGHLYSLVEKGQEAVDGILELAQESDQPRAFEVAGQLIKHVGDVADKLVDLQKKVNEIENPKKDKQVNTTNNTMFVGSTAELQKMLKGKSE